MWRFRRCYNLLNFSYAFCLNSIYSDRTQVAKLMLGINLSTNPKNFKAHFRSTGQFPLFYSTGFTQSNLDALTKPINVNIEYDDSDAENDDFSGEDDEIGTGLLGFNDQKINHDVGIIMEILRGIGSKNNPSQPVNFPDKPGVISGAEVTIKLNQCGISLTSELVVEVLSKTRNDWEVAFTFFLWAGKQKGYANSVREYHLMISILAKRRKFDTAWSLIDDMKRGGLVNPKTLLIMIRRYCAIHDVASAINTFHAFKRFSFPLGIEEFHKLLSALARYKNVQEAEHLLFSNKNTFPFNTKSFNIILNGWSNIIGSPREASRFWRLMIDQGIKVDVISFSSFISSYSKSNRLKEVLRLFHKMKEMDIDPDRKVYNAVIHALAKGGRSKEALNLLETMEGKGIARNAVSYNSLIKPLCKARKRDEARKVFDEILNHGLQPTLQTFHAFLRVQRTEEELSMLLDKMKELGCHPNKDTYILLIRKFCRWRHLDHVFKLWHEMTEKGLNDDSSSYVALIHGLFLNGKLEEAHRIYLEMKEKSFLPDAKTDELIQTWLSNKEMAESETIISEESMVDSSNVSRKGRRFTSNLDQGRGPESRKVVKERGFSFWEQ